MEDSDAQLQLKKRARRRLVGAVAFVLLVAVVLPMVMDSEPKTVQQEVDIRIPGQDEQPFAPRFAAAPPPVPPEAAVAAAPAASPGERRDAVAKAESPAPEAAPVAAPATRPAEERPLAGKTQEKAVTAERMPEKPSDKAEKQGRDQAAEARRAAAILAGKAAEPAARGGEHVILIGAFANEANVRNIRAKLGELGIRVYTEPLDSPQGKKTRVRAGPFASREAADRALDKMKRIGVSGVVAARQ